MAQGLLTVTAVVNFSVGPPNDWDLTVSNSAGVLVNDHYLGVIAGDVDGVWLVIAVPDGVTVRVRDSLNEGIGGGATEHGQPITSAAATNAPMGFATPTPLQGLTVGPEGSNGWRALVERNMHVIDGLL